MWAEFSCRTSVISSSRLEGSEVRGECLWDCVGEVFSGWFFSTTAHCEPMRPQGVCCTRSYRHKLKNTTQVIDSLMCTFANYIRSEKQNDFKLCVSRCGLVWKNTIHHCHTLIWSSWDPASLFTKSTQNFTPDGLKNATLVGKPWRRTHTHMHTGQEHNNVREKTITREGRSEPAERNNLWCSSAGLDVQMFDIQSERPEEHLPEKHTVSQSVSQSIDDDEG